MCLCGGVLMPEIESAPHVCECVCLKSFEHSEVRWLKDRFLYVRFVSGIILNFKQLSECVVLVPFSTNLLENVSNRNHVSY